MKLMKTTEAVGHVLVHDMTQIIPGVKKDAAFRKGHIVTKEDIPVLLSMGKENLYVWEKTEGMLHEDEAAVILGELCRNDGMEQSEIKEGKIQFTAAWDGVLKVDTRRLNLVNSLGEMIIATRHGNFPVKKGDVLSAARVIPLVIEEAKLAEAKEAAGSEPLLTVLPFQKKTAAIITTGNEVFTGLVEDAFGPVLKQKLAEYHIEVVYQKLVDDNRVHITEAIKQAIEAKAEIVCCTGGMSVDPDDQTPGGIRDTGAEIVSYGAPVLPGAMFLLAYHKSGRKEDGSEKQIPILGLPGCVMYHKRTIFDLILPRIVAGEQLKQEDLTILGEGGLCLNCEECRFPDCGFGK